MSSAAPAELVHDRLHGEVPRDRTVTGIVRRRGGTGVAGVEIDGKIVEGDAIVIALGPWSILAAEWLPLPAVFGLKGHSLVFETGTKVPAEALFLECREANGAVQTPEVFPRADGTTYVCAISSERPLPIDPAAAALGLPQLQDDYQRCWDALPKRFSPQGERP